MAQPDEYAGSGLKDRRFKLSRACDRCRRRRIKCDEGHPCQACMNSSSDCTFEETHRRPVPHKPKKNQILEDKMRQLEALIDAIPPSVFAAAQSNVYKPAGQQPLPQAALSTPVAGPGVHFASGAPTPALPSLLQQRLARAPEDPVAALAAQVDALSLGLAPPSMFFVDGQGHTRWHGETSGLPLLDFLVDAHAYRPPFNPHASSRDAVQDTEGGVSPQQTQPGASSPASSAAGDDGEGPPEVIWMTITRVIPAELMDELVKGFLSTSYYLLPFLHLPSFLQDYSTPAKWADLGFATFIVSLCCISSLHIDNPVVRSQNYGLKWFELYNQLRSLPGNDRPTLYTIQAVLIGAVFAVGQGLVSRALALLAEAVTLAMDAGLHRRADAYDWFDAREDQVRARTLWCIYVWDKQAAAQFGRPPLLRLRDCDVGTPAPLDDECIAPDGLRPQPPGVASRMAAFECLCHLAVVLDAVLDTPPSRAGSDAPDGFLARATGVLVGPKANGDLRAEEALLDDVVSRIPAHWAHSPATLASGDVVRITQAERLHCFEHYVRLLIARHRFSAAAAVRVRAGAGLPKSAAEVEAIQAVHASASRIIAVHLSIAARGLMTYYGIHVVHQLTQAGRSLVAVFLEVRADEGLRHLMSSTLEGLRSTFSLLRHFSGRYVCGMRATDMMEEICYLTQIPLNIPAHLSRANVVRGRWMNHIRKKPARPGASASAMARSPSSPLGQGQPVGGPEAFGADLLDPGTDVGAERYGAYGAPQGWFDPGPGTGYAGAPPHTYSTGLNSLADEALGAPQPLEYAGSAGAGAYPGAGADGDAAALLAFLSAGLDTFVPGERGEYAAPDEYGIPGAAVLNAGLAGGM